MIKVEHTKAHRVVFESFAGETINEIALVKLVLVECAHEEASLFRYKSTGTIHILPKKGMLVKGLVDYLKPIFISETEKIEVGDWYYDCLSKHISSVKLTDMTLEEQFSKGVFKILALPEHFSPQQLQLIVDGKLKDGDKVLIECERITTGITCTGCQEPDWCLKECERCEQREIGDANATGDKFEVNKITQVRLNPHITIYPVKEKKYTIKEIIDNLKYGLSQYGCKNELSGKWVLEDNIYHILNDLNKM